MLYHLIYPFHTVYSFLNVFRYITFRTILATITALVISFIIGPWLIRKLTDFQLGQSIREDVPRSHLAKEGTPTMGGMLILFALITPTLLWADLTNRYVWLVLLTTCGFSLVGFIDDLKKVRDRDGMGIKARYKFPLQIGIALAVSWVLYVTFDFSTQLWVPFFKRVTPNLGWLYIPFGVAVIVGTSNAVNLTDGLDGLAIGPVMVSGATFLLFSYLSGNYK
ncbi:MAG: phospho-N-acetylmuramoyl-pentapeptide-transferase, partial [Thermodesulfobacteriota bacterium]